MHVHMHIYYWRPVNIKAPNIHRQRLINIFFYFPFYLYIYNPSQFRSLSLGTLKTRNFLKFQGLYASLEIYQIFRNWSDFSWSQIFALFNGNNSIFKYDEHYFTKILVFKLFKSPEAYEPWIFNFIIYSFSMIRTQTPLY